MELSHSQIGLLISVWAGYGILHSTLASLSVKRWAARRWPASPRFYRLFFNLIALISLIPPFVVMHFSRGEALWKWSGIGFVVSNGLAALAIAGFLYSLRGYDTGEFLGTRQWRSRNTAVEDQEHFHISPFHRHVRHPWYFFALVILWTRSMDAALLVTAICLTLYFWWGSLLEERKLLVYHGNVYAEYRKRAPGLLPLPWRYLSRTEAEDLAKKYREAKRPGTE